MTSVPGRAPATTPSGPNRTASTSGVSETQMTTMSASATAAAAGDTARPMPCVAESRARSAVRFQPVTLKPARARFAAIAAPIVPSPRKATRVASVIRSGLA